jgi:hypothetical protein
MIFLIIKRNIPIINIIKALLVGELPRQRVRGQIKEITLSVTALPCHLSHRARLLK